MKNSNSRLSFFITITDPYHCVGSVDDGSDHKGLVHHWTLLLHLALPISRKSRQRDPVRFVPGAHLGQVLVLKEVEQVQRKLTPPSPRIEPYVSCQAWYAGEPHKVGNGGAMWPGLGERATLDAHSLKILGLAHLAQCDGKQMNSVINECSLCVETAREVCEVEGPTHDDLLDTRVEGQNPGHRCSPRSLLSARSVGQMVG